MSREDSHSSHPDHNARHKKASDTKRGGRFRYGEKRGEERKEKAKSRREQRKTDKYPPQY